MKFCPHCQQPLASPRRIVPVESGVYFAVFDDLLKVGQSADVHKRLVHQRSTRHFDDYELLGIIPCADVWPLRILETRVLVRMLPFLIWSEWHEVTAASLQMAGEIIADYLDRGMAYRRSHGDASYELGDWHMEYDTLLTTRRTKTDFSWSTYLREKGLAS